MWSTPKRRNTASSPVSGNIFWGHFLGSNLDIGHFRMLFSKTKPAGVFADCGAGGPCSGIEQISCMSNSRQGLSEYRVLTQATVVTKPKST